ncbi:MAG TPA: hypothetical protein VJN95_10635 [Gemmatimonadales bacterium]|nr:hypothetical protein [Gemmatimonadales bacterium]
MKYFHRSHVSPDQVMVRANGFFGSRLAPTEEAPRRRRFTGPVGQISVSAQAEGGHYTLITVETNQPGESEADKLAKRFLAELHTMEEPAYQVRGAY